MTSAAPSTSRSSSTVDRDRFPYRMKDLCELLGLDRQTIHFYIQQGLVPEGHKTGRNMAYYGPEHLDRIRLVRQLQRERFLPLKAIRALLSGEDEQFTDEQRQLLVEVRARLAPRLGTAGPRETVDALSLCKDHGVTRDELAAMESMGFFSTITERGKTLMNRDDAWMIEHWGEIRRNGLTPDRGFTVEDLAMYEEAISTLFEKESALMKDRVTHLPADELATLLERTLPLISTFLARYHQTKARNFFNAIID